MSMSSLDYLESAQKMLDEAIKSFKKGKFTSEVSYIHSAKQDMENALYYARKEHSNKDILESKMK